MWNFSKQLFSRTPQVAASDKDLLNSFSRIWYFNDCFKFSTLGSTSQYGNLSQAMHLHYTWLSHYVKSVQIRSYFWSVFSCIWTRNNSVFGHFLCSETCHLKQGLQLHNMNIFQIIQCKIPNVQSVCLEKIVVLHVLL